MSSNIKAAIYARVSKAEEGQQDPENQLAALRSLAEALNLVVVREYVDHSSGGSADRPQFQEMLRAAQKHEFDIILIWALDRFSREGILQTLSYLKQLDQANVSLKSLQESWLDTRDKGFSQLLIAIFSWVAQQERERISRRTCAALQRKKNLGQRLGRPQGSKDKGRRRRSGYIARWNKQRGR